MLFFTKSVMPKNKKKSNFWSCSMKILNFLKKGLMNYSHFIT